jgi:hypothetical protein
MGDDMTPVNVIVIIRNKNSNEIQTLNFFDVGKAKTWLVNYANQKEMIKSDGTYFNDNECIWMIDAKTWETL